MIGNKSDTWRIIGMITVALTVIMLYGLSMALLSMTIVDLWKIAAISMGIAFATGISMFSKWHRLTHCRYKAINFLCHVVATTAISTAIILSANYFLRDEELTRTETAPVERIYTETRYHRKRISRKVYTRGEPYKVYFMEVRLPDGTSKNLQISLQSYNRLKAQKTRTTILKMTPGALGMTIVRHSWN